MELPPAELFPAAYVKFTPQVPVGGPESAYVEWKLETDGQPPWLDRFKAAEENVRPRYSHELSAPVRVFAPAGLRLRMTFRGSDNLMGEPAAPDRVLQLSQGGMEDLGEVRFVPASTAAESAERREIIVDVLDIGRIRDQR